MSLIGVRLVVLKQHLVFSADRILWYSKPLLIFCLVWFIL